MIQEENVDWLLATAGSIGIRWINCCGKMSSETDATL
jgi:hypothetical protein